MRRLGAALLVLAALCAVSSIVSEEMARINGSAESGVEEAMRLAETGNMEKAVQKLKETAEPWREKRAFLEAFLHHETIEHAEEGFLAAAQAANISPEVFLLEAAKLSATLHTLARGDLPETGNLF